MNSDIFSILVGTPIKDPSHIIKQGWQGSRPFMTGCLIITDDVFSICNGTVVDVGVDDKNNLYSVSIEYTYQIWIRYCMLQTCNVSVGDTVSVSDKIGSTYKGILRFEYCTDEFSVFPYRNGDRQLYKHDPIAVLTGEIALPEIDDPGDIVILDDYVDEDIVDVEDK